MEIVTVRFTSRWPPNPASPVIARLGGDKFFSHSMNIIDGKAFEAVMFGGCRVVDLELAMKGVKLYQDMYVPVQDLAAAVAWGEEIDGRDYDYAGAFGIPFLMSEDWSDESCYWCSEHNFVQIRKGGTDMLDPDVHKRVTPGHLRMCNFPKSKVIKL